MSDLITALTSLFSFLISVMGDVADFFVESTIGQLILGIALFSLIVYMIMYIIDKVKG